jgi:hypothetical protein
MCDRLARAELDLAKTPLEVAHETLKTGHCVLVHFSDGFWRVGKLQRLDRDTCDIGFSDSIELGELVPNSALSRLENKTKHDPSLQSGFEMPLVDNGTMSEHIVALDAATNYSPLAQISGTSRGIALHLRQTLETVNLADMTMRMIREELVNHFGDIIKKMKQWIKTQTEIFLAEMYAASDSQAVQPGNEPPIALPSAQTSTPSAQAASLYRTEFTIDREAMGAGGGMCTVCLEDLDQLPADTSMTIVRCGHVFCSNCIADWFYCGKKCCPNCNKGFSSLRNTQTTTVRELLETASTGSASWYG